MILAGPLFTACGVRGPPVAPKDPPWIGSGRPRYFEPPSKSNQSTHLDAIGESESASSERLAEEQRAKSVSEPDERANGQRGPVRGR
jgi:hypothetical protein